VRAAGTERVELVSQAPLIAVVDDDEAIRTSLEALIRSLGHRVASFDSAAAFLASEVSDGADCLISDVQMPGLSGFDIQQALGERGVPTPVILITAFDDARARARGLDLGATCFLKKPFSGDSIIGCLETALAPRAKSPDA